MFALAGRPTSFVLTAPLLAGLASAGLGQVSCREWSGDFAPPGVDGSVLATHVWDDGSGPALYLAGDFEVAGTAPASDVVRWDGSTWTALEGPAGNGMGGYYKTDVHALMDFDDGSGPALYATGFFLSAGGAQTNMIARWDGTQWSDVGGGLTPFGYSAIHGYDLEVYDDGSGEALYVAGGFLAAGGVAVEGLARWDGTAWSSVGGQSFHISVQAIAPFDDGSGEKLYVGGTFEAVWGSPSDFIACWDGAAWSGLPDVLGDWGWVSSLETFDDGSGEALYVGGYFQVAGGGFADYIARWDGTAWSTVGAGTGFPVDQLEVYDTGGGPALYALGDEVARWNGVSWTTAGDGTNDDVRTLALFDDGGGPRLFAGGLFTTAGTQEAWGVARLNGSSWESLLPGLGTLDAPDDMVEFDDGSGTRLYVDIQLGLQGGTASVAAWDGSGWTPLGGPFDGDIWALCVFDDGAGPRLHAGGLFADAGGVPASNIARWSGSAWEPLGPGLDNTVGSMTVWDDGSGPVLVAGGRFKNSGSQSLKFIAAWDGTSWAPLDVGMGGSGLKWVYALEPFDDGLGGGPALFAAGRFDLAGGNPAANIARWDGTSWSAVSSGIGGGDVFALTVHDDGSGPSLFAGGSFWSAGGVFARRVAKWNGLTWAAVGTTGNELLGPVDDFTTLDLGAGSVLVAVGGFEVSVGSPANYIATWDGSLWSPLPVEPNGDVLSAIAHDDGTGAGPALFLGGWFETIGSTPSVGFGRWRVECPCPPAPYCTAKVNSQGCTPTIFATGTPSLATNSLRVKASNVLNNKTGLLFWGQLQSNKPFQGGTKCVASPSVRTPVQQSGGNPPPDDCSGFYSFHWNNPYLSSKGLTAGDTVHCQSWSRDPQSPSTTGLTDGLTFTLCP